MKRSLLLFCALSMLLLPALALRAQVTTGAMNGIVTDKDGKPISGVRVVATHEPSGTKYGAVTNSTGRYNLPALRSGKPYSVRFTGVGIKEAAYGDISIKLGDPYELNVKMEIADVKLGEITVTSKKNAVLSEQRTGASTNIGKEIIETMPTLNRSIADFTRTTPQANGLSFGGQDNRYINLTIDGSVYNNSFGLSNLPGGQANSTPISLDAIEEVQVNIAPFDVRQGGFVGAGLNAITRKGDNQFRASAFYNFRNETFVGQQANGVKVNTAQFDVKQYGLRFGGPIIENKLFFFVNGEIEERRDPATPQRASTGPADLASNFVRPGLNLADSLNKLKQFLIDKYGYDPGIYQDYYLQTFSAKATARLDYNIDENQKVAVRFNYLRSYRDVLTSSSITGSGTSAGRNYLTGNGGVNAINFSNSNYRINNDIISAIVEYNGVFGDEWYVNANAGYTANRDYRSRPTTQSMPTVDILLNGVPVTTFGDEPFSIGNKLDTDTWQAQVNLTRYLGDHTLTLGASLESFAFVNGFNPQLSGMYQFNSFTDFYQAAAGANVRLNAYNLTYSAQPNGETPFAKVNAQQYGFYLQDEWAIAKQFKVTLGVRGDIITFGQTAQFNAQVPTLKFQGLGGEAESYSTSQLPNPQLLFSPRLGFNWDASGDRTTQVRGGLGVFTGRVPYVIISNQASNNGVLSGAFSMNAPTLNVTNLTGTTTPLRWSPNTAVGQNPNIPADAGSRVPPASYRLDLVNPNLKYPQIFRANAALDQELPLGIIGTLEGVYSQNINAIFYRNANLRTTTGTFSGIDNRPRYYGSFGYSNQINSNLTDALIVDNTNLGSSLQLTAQLQRTFDFGLYTMVAYTFSQSRDLSSYGSTAGSSYNGVLSVGGNNYPVLSYSDNDITNRFIANIGYRINWADIGAPSWVGKTGISIFIQAQNQARLSFTYRGDMNGDGIQNNDLMFVPADQSQIALLPLTVGSGSTAKTIDAATQWAELNKFISQDPYLSTRRGQYAERNGLIRPILTRVDLSLTHEFVLDLGKPTGIQARFDIFNFTNMLNNSWGIADINNLTNPLQSVSTTAGVPQFRTAGLFDATGNAISPGTLRSGAAIGDVWQMQFGIRVTFN